MRFEEKKIGKKIHKSLVCNGYLGKLPNLHVLNVLGPCNIHFANQ